MQNRNKVIAAIAPVRSSVHFALIAILMLATPLILFAIGCARNSVFLVDGSGALFGMDITLLLWLRDEWSRAPDRTAPAPRSATATVANPSAAGYAGIGSGMDRFFD